MKTKIVVDTNVLIDNPDILEESNYDFSISYITLQELDKLKGNQDLSYPARRAIKTIFGLYKENKIQILNVPTDNETNDEKIVQDAKDIGATLMSQDIGALVVAESKGVATYDLNKVDKEWDKNYKGYIEYNVDDKFYYKLTQNEYQHDEIEQFIRENNDSNIDIPLNCYLVLYPLEIGINYMVFKKLESKYRLIPQGTKHLRSAGIGIDWLHPEQLVAFDCVFNDDAPLAVITGKIGASKTLMSICGALSRTCGHKNKKLYDKVLVTRPNVSINRQYELGFMKGPQPLWSNILTPNGWVKMGDIKVNDYVIGRDGKSVRVKGVYPQGKKEIYKIETDTHKTTYACGDHLWYTQNFNEKKHNKKGSIKTTLDIMNSLRYKDTNKLNHYLPINNAVEFNNMDLPLHPYVLGCLLGDGHIRKNGSINISSVDADLIERINILLKPISAGTLGKSGITYTIGAIDGRGNKPRLSNNRDFIEFTNPVKKILNDLDLLGTHFDTKFIPYIYMYRSSYEDRLELLRGLLDTDGNVYRGRYAVFNSSNKNLAYQVLELVRSLGGYGYVNERDRRGRVSNSGGRNIITKHLSYEVTINLGRDTIPFYLKRKVDEYASKYISNRKDTVIRDRIKSITPYKEEEVQCIALDNEEHLYITDDYIVTHNTLEEKMDGWLAPIKTNLQFLYENNLKDKENEEATKIYESFFEAMPIQSIQGASFHNKILLVDESQLLDTNTLRQIMSRVAEGSKLVLILDPSQTYGANRGQEGYKKLLPHCKGSKYINFVELQHIQRSELTKVVDEIFK